MIGKAPKHSGAGIIQYSIMLLVCSFWFLSIYPPPVLSNQISLNRSQDPNENKHIVETVFRHLVSEHSPEWHGKIHFIILCVDSSSTAPGDRFGLSLKGRPRDISDEMFRNLSNLPIPLKKQQDCSYLNVHGEVAQEGE